MVQPIKSEVLQGPLLELYMLRINPSTSHTKRRLQKHEVYFMSGICYFGDVEIAVSFYEKITLLDA